MYLLYESNIAILLSLRSQRVQRLTPTAALLTLLLNAIFDLLRTAAGLQLLIAIN
jgi:hypothetical protein